MILAFNATWSGSSAQQKLCERPPFNESEYVRGQEDLG